MSAVKTSEQAAMRQTAARLAGEVLAPAAAERDEEYRFGHDGFRALGRAGMTGMLLPAEYGGASASLDLLVLVLEEIAKACASTALSLLSHAVACQAVAEFGESETKSRYLPSMAAGEKLGAFAVHESASGSAAGAVQTRAQRDGNCFVVNGDKFFVTNGGVADCFVALARSGKQGEPASFSLLLIDRNQAGVSGGSVYRRMGLNGTAATDLYFSDCRVGAGNLLGGEGHGLAAVAGLVAGVALPGMAAIALGLAEAALEAAVRHARHRTIEGKALAIQPAIQMMIGDMATTVQAMRGMLDLSLKLGTPLAAWQAKLFCVERALEVTDCALQVHGGQGYTRDLPVERYYRDARGLKLHFLTTELLQGNIGKKLLEIF